VQSGRQDRVSRWVPLVRLDLVTRRHQNEQEAVGRSRNYEEVGRYDLADVIPRERAPGSATGAGAVAPCISEIRWATTGFSS
jgi:hypothetical protein